MMFIKTIQDININDYKLLDKTYKGFKKAVNYKHKDNPFYMDEQLAKDLMYQKLIQEQTVRNSETREMESTGKYMLTIEGKFYLEYRHNQTKDKMIQGVYNWVTLIIATIALALSLIGIVLDHQIVK